LGQREAPSYLSAVSYPFEDLKKVFKDEDEKLGYAAVGSPSSLRYGEVGPGQLADC